MRSSVKKRRMSHIDITYIDREGKDDDDKDDEKKDDEEAQISPSALVDIYA